MVPPPHVPTPVFSISALGRDGFLSCRTAWVNGRKSACKSYVSSLSSSAKLSPRTQIGRIQTYSKRILLNTPRIQDSRFKVPGRTLPCTLNLESWIRGVFNRIRFEYVWIRNVAVWPLHFVFRACRCSVDSRRFVLYRYYRFRAGIAET